MSALGLWPWQGEVLAEALAQWRSSAVLMHGEPGCGQLALALAVARAWLCEGPDQAEAQRAGRAPIQACGQCPSCHLVDAGYHPDLIVAVPEATWAELGWNHAAPGEDGDSSDNASPTAPQDGKAEGKKRKASTEIKVEAIRQVVAFAQSTVSRGRAKVVLIYPAERLNSIAANTLLKTLEDPPGHVRFVLSGGSIDALLPTVRSRCQAWHLPLPGGRGGQEAAAVLAWLQTQGQGPPLSEADAHLLLAAAGGRPLAALDLLKLGWSAPLWRGLCQQVRQGQVGAWAAWPLPVLVQTLHKLCHDLSCVSAGGAPRFFPADALGPGGDLPRLHAWAQTLREAQRHANHPWNAPLKLEAVLFQARRHTHLG